MLMKQQKTVVAVEAKLLLPFRIRSLLWEISPTQTYTFIYTRLFLTASFLYLCSATEIFPLGNLNTFKFPTVEADTQQ